MKPQAVRNIGAPTGANLDTSFKVTCHPMHGEIADAQRFVADPESLSQAKINTTAAGGPFLAIESQVYVAEGGTLIIRQYHHHILHIDSHPGIELAALSSFRVVVLGLLTPRFSYPSNMIDTPAQVNSSEGAWPTLGENQLEVQQSSKSGGAQHQRTAAAAPTPRSSEDSNASLSLQPVGNLCAPFQHICEMLTEHGHYNEHRSEDISTVHSQNKVYIKYCKAAFMLTCLLLVMRGFFLRDVTHEHFGSTRPS